MLKLNEEGLKNKEAWLEKGYEVAGFDRELMIENTQKEPRWIHFGAGNIFRAFQVDVMQRLLEGGHEKSGLIATDGFDYEIISKMYRPHDNYSISVVLHSDGKITKKVLASIGETCIMDSEDEVEWKRMKEIFSNPSLQMASFTITEKGYSLSNSLGEYFPAVSYDFENGYQKPQSYIGKLCALVYQRFKSGALPLALVSMDNCSHNGARLQEAVCAYGKAWVDKGLVEKEFLAYLNDEVSFPWTVIDKITPRPDKDVEALLASDGLADLEPIVTTKNTYVAPFVNSEESEYLVIEDKFPNGRPALEKGGVYFADRDTVNDFEKMKVCTCLNPLHTALAVYGCLLGYEKIADEMKDEDLLKLVNLVGYKEGLPVVVDPKIISPKEFIDTVVKVRIPNPFMPDTPQRIATDTSQKLAIRFGETIKAYLNKGEDISFLKGIPLVYAGWLRYLLALDDEGKQMELSSDPLLEEVRVYVADITLDEEVDNASLKIKLLPLLRNKKIFGVDLEAVGLADKVLGYFERMLMKGGVRKTLQGELNV